MRLSRRFIENLLLIGRAGPRFLHESAVQIDVWAAFGERPEEPVDLLLTPQSQLSAARLAARLHDFIFGPTITDGRQRPTPDAAAALTEYRPEQPPRIFPLEGFVAVHAEFDLFLRVLLPLTRLDLQATYADLEGLVVAELHDPMRRSEAAPLRLEPPLDLRSFLRFARERRTTLTPEMRLTLLYLLLMAPERPSVREEVERYREVGLDPAARIELPETLDDLIKALDQDLPGEPVLVHPPSAVRCPDGLVWQVARNRPVQLMATSAETVKADAARRLFQTSARQLVWAVIDSGVDGSHPAFRDHELDGFASRVVKAFDFSQLRDIAAYDRLLDEPARQALVDELTAEGLSSEDAIAWLERLREDAFRGRPFDWSVLERLLETPPDRLTAKGPDGKFIGHGTHVAGVLAGDWRENGQPVFQGVCPDLRIYDLRILGKRMEDTEFAIIAALEFVRWLNARNRYLTIHGVNLSVGLVHDVRNFACGQTPVCRACDATVRAGVVVVAAAGNWGYQDFTTQDGSYRGYATVSIADPGNTESVITVGATHRDRPHEYGVSYFSSRGPTGDGRSKPDLVAPGEKIEGPLPELGLGNLDGTSMAAPHVSGVAALLMARHAELIGRPMAIKQILTETATDLGRERHFQGAGLVDALRALQAR